MKAVYVERGIRPIFCPCFGYSCDENELGRGQEHQQMFSHLVREGPCQHRRRRLRASIGGLTACGKAGRRRAKIPSRGRGPKSADGLSVSFFSRMLGLVRWQNVLQTSVRLSPRVPDGIHVAVASSLYETEAWVEGWGSHNAVGWDGEGWPCGTSDQ